MADRPKFLIAAGGTGGHVAPAATVAGELKKLLPEADFLFVGVGRQAEVDILDPLGYRRKVLKVPTLAGKNPFRALLSLFGLFVSLVRAVAIVRDYKPDICLAFGGYVCGPLGLAAKIFGLPLILHEQNTLPGITNRWLGKIADLVMVGFPEAEEAFKGTRVEPVGNPVRREISDLAEMDRSFANSPKTILVVGGSQGARRLNLAVIELAKTLKKKSQDFKLVHQTGSAMVEEIGALYKDLNLPAQAKSFISDMAGAYRQADLAIARAGALTLAELVAAKLPAILVPLPTAAGDHQTVNAGAIEKLGLARVVLEKDLVGGELETIVLELLRHPEQLKAMSQKAVEESRKAAAVGPKMAELCLEVMKEKALSQNQTPDQD